MGNSYASRPADVPSLESAHHNGDLTATFLLARYYEEGIYLSPDSKKATELWEHLRRHKHWGTQTWSSSWKFNDSCVHPDPSSLGAPPLLTVYPDSSPPPFVFDVLQKGVEHQDEVSMTLLAGLYLGSCEEIPQRKTSAISLVERAAKKGYPDAMFQMMQWLRVGFGDVQRSEEQALQICLDLCRKGWMPAQHELGRWYDKGLIVEKDPRKALQMYEVSTQAGYVPSLFHMGHFYARETCNGVVDREQAVSYFLRSATRGHVDSMYQLARLADRPIQIYWGQQAAKKGCVEAMVLLGQETRISTPGFALTWFREAADLGHIPSMRCLATMYKEGEGMPPSERMYLVYMGMIAVHSLLADDAYAFAHAFTCVYDSQRIAVTKTQGPLPLHSIAEEWYLHAARQGHAGAMYELGTHTVEESEGSGGDKQTTVLKVPRQPHETASFWLEKAASQQHPQAMYTWGKQLVCPDPGSDRPGRPDRFHEGITWLEKAAQVDHVDAILFLGRLYHHGSGPQECGRRIHAAILWYDQAERRGVKVFDVHILMHATSFDFEHEEMLNAWDSTFRTCQKLAHQESGPAGAMHLLGLCYEFQWGSNTKRDMKQACLWYERAAQAGHVESMFELGRCTPDAQVASQWFLQAAEHGHVDAMAHVALRLQCGVGVNADASLAYTWWVRAAEKGQKTALQVLAKANDMRVWTQERSDPAVHGFRWEADMPSPSLVQALAYFQAAYDVSVDECGIDVEGWDALTSVAIKQSPCQRMGSLDSGGNWIKGVIYEWYWTYHINTDDDPKEYAERLQSHYESAWSIDHDHVEAMYRLGRCYQKGIGVSKDLGRAHQWLEGAAQRDHVFSMIQLAAVEQEAHQTKTRNIKPNTDEDQDKVENKDKVEDEDEDSNLFPVQSARAWYEKAHWRIPPGPCVLRLGMVGCARTGLSWNAFRTSRAWDRTAKEEGNASALFESGLCHHFGIGEDADPKKAYEYYKCAVDADRTHTGALCALGMCYWQGEGIERDHQQALLLWNEAAALGDRRGICIWEEYIRASYPKRCSVEHMEKEREIEEDGWTVIRIEEGETAQN